MKHTLLFMLIIFSCTLFSQDNFIPGFIIELNGDTAHGYIDYQNWRINPHKVTFKNSAGAPPVDYKPSQIKAFRVAGKIYESAEVQVETSPNDNDNLMYDGSFYYRTDSAFLQARFMGPKSLYYIVTEDWKDHFYIRTDSVYQLLAYKKYLVESGNYGNIYKAENNKYRGQLSTYLGACPGLDYKIQNAHYNKSSLDKLFLEYSSCTGEKYDFIRQKEERKTEFGFLAGMTMTKVNFNGSGNPYLVDVDYSPSYNFTIGMFIDYIQFKSARKWSVSNEVIFTAFDIQGHHDVYVDEKNNTRSVINMSFFYTKWHLLGRYKFPAGKMFFYANAGPSLGIGSEGENTMVQYIKIYGLDRTRTEIALDKTKTFEMGVVGGFGARLGQFTLEARYEWGNGFSGDDDLTAMTNRMYFLLGFRL